MADKKKDTNKLADKDLDAVQGGIVEIDTSGNIAGRGDGPDLKRKGGKGITSPGDVPV